MKKLFFAALALCMSVCASATVTDTTSAGEMDSTSYSYGLAMEKLDSAMKALDYKTGKIMIQGDLATVTVPDGFAYLDSKDAQFVLTDLWNNPEDHDILGMLVPKGVDLLASESWAIIYSYEEDGHVDDDDAEDTDYAELLGDMQKEISADNSSRVAAGYPAMELIGWAKTPFYDKASHKLHWAKEIKFGTDSLNTLNYNIRMLGRKGVLVMNIVSGMDNMKVVEANINKILASTDFTSGNTYADFDSGVDKVAEYGIGGLIAGGILLKTGLLAKLGIFLLKAWKFIAIGVVGLIAFLRKKFAGRKDNSHDNHPKLD
ncbi:MAG: putative rane-anchored protein-like protein [Bacteroidetes bacterium]|nr:putative rane-anchored protein-like protein [Bacteroidota bacterium]